MSKLDIHILSHKTVKRSLDLGAEKVAQKYVIEKQQKGIEGDIVKVVEGEKSRVSQIPKFFLKFCMKEIFSS